ncbi:MAG TPA: transglutaminase, partial [Mariniflexile sp.]
QVGNDAEINLMLTAMLRYAGLNANPVLVSSRNNGIPLFPTLDGYNYVVSAIETLDGVILLDATSKYSTPNILPFRTLNWEGRIVRKDKSSSTISLYPKEKSKKTVSMIASLKDTGNLEGGIRTVKTNHDAMIYREQYLEADKNQYLEKLESKYANMEIDGFEVKNEMDLSKPIMESFKFTLENQADIIADKLYFSPLFFLRTKENPFKLEKREFPVDFGYPSSSKYMINIDLPEGYKVEVIPEPLVMTMPDNLGTFKYNISAIDNKIQLVIDTEINESIISPIYYEALKEYFRKMIEKEAEQIVLTKV